MFRFPFFAILAVTIVAIPSLISAQKNEAVPTRFRQNPQDARNTTTGEAPPPRDPEFEQYALFENTAPRAAETAPVATTLPLDLQPGERIAFIGNGLLEQSQWAGYFESFLHQRYPEHQLVIRNFCWSADTPDLQPRPENFADLDQHLTHYKIDVIFASYGFNESFAGEPGLPKFREALSRHLSMLKRKAFNGKTGPRIVLLSPIANENVERVPAGQLNNESLRLYTDAMREVANEQQVGFVDLFSPTLEAIAQADKPLTKNGVHLNDRGYETFARAVYRQTFGEDASAVNEQLREAIVDKNRQFFRRYRPVNTFYYTGGRNKDYGYLDFLPAMKNFELMVESREERIWNVAQGQNVPEQPDDSQLPELPPTVQSRGANEWLSAEEELKAFQVDPRFEVTLFAGEEEFPELAAPIQMRWDSRGRLWVSCSTTYPHVYPGNEPNDKIIILEDTDRDGRADKSTVFADDLHIPLSFEFGDGGVYVSEQPDLTFLRDTDGDDKADVHEVIFTGFGTEDSHHSLHDFAWTPDGDLIFRESIFHHSQVETPWGPVRQQNSGWFRMNPRRHHLLSFGTYHSTNPWGVTFDDWGNHVASHPVFAAAFHSLDPPYPQQHPRPVGLQAYSGVCGHEFVDFDTFPDDLQGDHFIKVRYKPTNRVEILKWKETEFGYEEEYVSDLVFSTNLSFIPVDLRYGPDGAMYVCDWYNPVKGHAQYSLRDERRDRHSGRIWRITAKDKPTLSPPNFAEMSVGELVATLGRREYRYRYWAKRELRERDSDEVRLALNNWLAQLDKADPRYPHHQLEALWTGRSVGQFDVRLLRELLESEDHHARAAAVQQIRYTDRHLDDEGELLMRAAQDPKGLVRMEAAIAASYVGTPEALEAVVQTLNHPVGGHLAYAIRCSLGSEKLRAHWETDPSSRVPTLMARLEKSSELKEPKPSAAEAEFDRQPNLATIQVSCVPERMRFSMEEIAVFAGQPVKIVFSNPDANDHNFVLVKPGALEEVGMAANEMAKDPKNANSDFIPQKKRSLILDHSPMIGPNRKTQIHVLRFVAPEEPGVYPFVCTFPGHWVVMKGNMAVGETLEAANKMLADLQPQIVREWSLADFPEIEVKQDEQRVMRGMNAFMKARCTQCHKVAGHGVELGPDLADVAKRFQGKKLLQQLLEPSVEINKKFQPQQFILKNGKVVAGVVMEETDTMLHVVSNLLTPQMVTKVPVAQIEERIPSRVSPMPTGLLNVLQRDEILDLLTFLESGGYKLPDHIHGHHHK